MEFEKNPVFRLDLNIGDPAYFVDLVDLCSELGEPIKLGELSSLDGLEIGELGELSSLDGLELGELGELSSLDGLELGELGDPSKPKKRSRTQMENRTYNISAWCRGEKGVRMWKAICAVRSGRATRSQTTADKFNVSKRSLLRYVKRIQKLSMQLSEKDLHLIWRIDR